ncbi:MAG: response regulator [Bacillota bacterium]|nr:response regulator [Bacillota bacterium]
MIRVIVIDDELPSLNRLKKQLEDSGKVKVQGSFTGPLEALAYLGENKVDAVFLDIEMPDIDGIELASRTLDLQGNIAIVFVTAYNQYAVEAFRLNALDYLLKPVSQERLQETLCRIIDERGITLDNKGLSISCFGKFCVKAGGKEVKFRTEKAEELLAYLINSRGVYLSRNNIIDCLWEDFEGDRAVVHFNTTLHNIKRALLPYDVRISIQYDRGNYRMDSEGINCDYLKFCNFIEHNPKADSDNIMNYEETASLYTGEYLSGWSSIWAGGKRIMLEEQFILLMLELARYHRSISNYQKALEWLKKGFLYEPLHRELNYRLIETLLLINERSIAIKYYELYKDSLAKKLKTEPDAAFKQLLEKV